MRQTMYFFFKKMYGCLTTIEIIINLIIAQPHLWKACQEAASYILFLIKFHFFPPPVTCYKAKSLRREQLSPQAQSLINRPKIMMLLHTTKQQFKRKSRHFFLKLLLFWFWFPSWSQSLLFQVFYININ